MATLRTPPTPTRRKRRPAPREGRRISRSAPYAQLPLFALAIPAAWHPFFFPFFFFFLLSFSFFPPFFPRSLPISPLVATLLLVSTFPSSHSRFRPALCYGFPSNAQSLARVSCCSQLRAVERATLAAVPVCASRSAAGEQRKTYTHAEGQSQGQRRAAQARVAGLSETKKKKKEGGGRGGGREGELREGGESGGGRRRGQRSSERKTTRSTQRDDSCKKEENTKSPREQRARLERRVDQFRGLEGPRGFQGPEFARLRAAARSSAGSRIRRAVRSQGERERA